MIGRVLLLFAALSCLGPVPASAVTLDSSVAITDPETLQALERGGLSISRLLGPALGLTRDVDNRGLFSVRALSPVRNAVKQQIVDEPRNSPDSYVTALATRKTSPRSSIRNTSTTTVRRWT
ncbi:hypothetical protein NKH89_23210 [Mesorhizobium sp. M0923]|uniref:hypothetical protein n=1 Tax=Mesorhizobium sp. M0923 TaxID=2957028 RepID=UPI003336FC9F